jgi:hypothetical protein
MNTEAINGCTAHPIYIGNEQNMFWNYTSDKHTGVSFVLMCEVSSQK